MSAQPVTPEPQEWSAYRAPHVIVDTDDPAFVCRRCETRTPFIVPVRFFAWHEEGQQFLTDHRACRPPAREVETIQPSLL